MDRPVMPDNAKADQESKKTLRGVRKIFPQTGIGEYAQCIAVRNLDLNDQQRDADRKNAIGEKGKPFQLKLRSGDIVSWVMHAVFNELVLVIRSLKIGLFFKN